MPGTDDHGQAKMIYSREASIMRSTDDEGEKDWHQNIEKRVSFHVGKGDGKVWRKKETIIFLKKFYNCFPLFCFKFTLLMPMIQKMRTKKKEKRGPFFKILNLNRFNCSSLP